MTNPVLLYYNASLNTRGNSASIPPTYALPVNYKLGANFKGVTSDAIVKDTHYLRIAQNKNTGDICVIVNDKLANTLPAPTGVFGTEIAIFKQSGSEGYRINALDLKMNWTTGASIWIGDVVGWDGNMFLMVGGWRNAATAAWKPFRMIITGVIPGKPAESLKVVSFWQDTVGTAARSQIWTAVSTKFNPSLMKAGVPVKDVALAGLDWAAGGGLISNGTTSGTQTSGYLLYPYATEHNGIDSPAEFRFTNSGLTITTTKPTAVFGSTVSEDNTWQTPASNYRTVFMAMPYLIDYQFKNTLATITGHKILISNLDAIKSSDAMNLDGQMTYKHNVGFVRATGESAQSFTPIVNWSTTGQILSHACFAGRTKATSPSAVLGSNGAWTASIATVRIMNASTLRYSGCFDYSYQNKTTSEPANSTSQSRYIIHGCGGFTGFYSGNSNSPYASATSLSAGGVGPCIGFHGSGLNTQAFVRFQTDASTTSPWIAANGYQVNYIVCGRYNYRGEGSATNFASHSSLDNHYIDGVLYAVTELDGSVVVGFMIDANCLEKNAGASFGPPIAGVFRDEVYFKAQRFEKYRMIGYSISELNNTNSGGTASASSPVAYSTLPTRTVPISTVKGTSFEPLVVTVETGVWNYANSSSDLLVPRN